MKSRIIRIIKEGGIGVLPTDTLYGFSASALDQPAVEKVYKLKKRNPQKPLIVLINSWQDLDKLSINIDKETKQKLNEIWPASVSVVLPCQDEKFTYLHRGTDSLAIRWPDYKVLNNILEQTGPLVSTTVNVEGEEPAKTIKEAKSRFGDQVDFYLNAGELSGNHSTLIKIENNKIKVLRRGAKAI